MKIFFDLDGTILDVKRKCYMVYLNLLSHDGFNVIDVATYWKMKRDGVSEKDIVATTTTSLFTDYYIKKRISLIDTVDYLALDEMFDFVPTVLNRLSSDHDLYLATLRYNKTNLNNQLSFFDLNKYFKGIYTADGLGVRKDTIIKHKVVDKSNCVIIGDTELDIKAGKRVGIKTVGVTSGVRNKHSLEKINPDFLAKNIYDSKLFSWIENNS